MNFIPVSMSLLHSSTLNVAGATLSFVSVYVKKKKKCQSLFIVWFTRDHMIDQNDTPLVMVDIIHDLEQMG